MRIFLDLDGTILDISNKYNHLYSSLRNKYGLRDLDYWKIRSSGIGFEKALLSAGISSGRLSEFRNEWSAAIERDDALKHDLLFEGVWDKLHNLSVGNDIFLCTARANSESLLVQLGRLGIRDVFAELLMTKNAAPKSQTISDYYARNSIGRSEDDWLIGDTQSDIQAGQSIGIRTCGVTTGLSTELMLKDAGATKVLDRLTQFTPHV